MVVCENFLEYIFSSWKYSHLQIDSNQSYTHGHFCTYQIFLYTKMSNMCHHFFSRHLSNSAKSARSYFCRNQIYLLKHTHCSKGQSFKITINCKIWIVTIPTNCTRILYLSDLADLLIVKTPEYLSQNFVISSKLDGFFWKLGCYQ